MLTVISGPVLESMENGAREKAPRSVQGRSAPAPLRFTPPPGRRPAGAAIALAAAALLLAGLGGHAARQIEHAPDRPAGTALPVYLPRTEFLRLVSLGYENVLADIMWFRTISYFGLHYRSDRLYPWLARMCDVVTDLDSRAHHVYRFAGVILPWEAGLPDEGIALLEKGIRVFPDSWVLHYFLGFNYFFFKNDAARALPHVRRATELPGTHPFVSRFATLLYSAQYGPEAARAFLEDLAGSAEGADFKNVIREHLDDLQLAEDIGGLEAAIAAYRDRFTTAPETLEQLVTHGFIERIPSEPFGGRYLYDPDKATVASSLGRKPLRMYTSVTRSKVLRGEPARD